MHIEKEKKFGLHTSSRNSEVIHSGFYYPENSLKARLCVKGNDMMYSFCKKYNIPHQNCGKLVVANSDDEIDIRVCFPEEYRKLEQLDQLRIPTNNGPVPLSIFVERSPSLLAY